MSSYLPPRENLSSFNPSVFDSDITTTEIDTKIKTLDKFKLETISNQYIEASRIYAPSGVVGGSVVFTKTFKTTPDVITQVINNSTTAVSAYKIYNITTTGFDYLGRKYNGSVVNNTAADFFYMAVGNR